MIDKLILNEEEYEFNGGGLSDEAKQALITCLQQVAWVSDDGQDYLNALMSAMGVTNATGITLNKSELEIRMTHEDTVVATLSPEGAVGIVLWESSDPSVATVSNGTITPISVGTTVITARVGQYSASCEVTVLYPLGFFTGSHEFADGTVLETSNGNHFKLTFATPFTNSDIQFGLTTLDLNGTSITRADNSQCTTSDISLFDFDNSTLVATLTKTSSDSISKRCTVYINPTMGNGFDIIDGCTLDTATKTTTVTGKTTNCAGVGMWAAGGTAGMVYEADLEIICDGVRIL